MRAARLLPAFVVAAVVLVAAPAFAANVWPNYGGSNRTSNDTSAPSLNPLHTAWTKALDQKVYGQPLVFDGRVYAATENDTVYALDAHDGSILWSRHVGTPMTNVSSQVGCGNVDPLGILSTPVIDTATNTIYVVATIEDAPNNIHHQLIGLEHAHRCARRFRPTPTRDVAPCRRTRCNIQQRTGLGSATAASTSVTAATPATVARTTAGWCRSAKRAPAKCRSTSRPASTTASARSGRRAAPASTARATSTSPPETPTPAASTSARAC